jgi:6-pyruvoyltetrahydropterin/6-carboxytetrahydropterin synthase
MHTVTRYHDISCGHRVHGHESKCANLHGHNYRIIFTCRAPKLDKLGRVIDFSVIKSWLCQWLEENWDHKFLVWERDPMGPVLRELNPNGVVFVPFNPTAENMAEHLVLVIAPLLLQDVELVACTVEETRKCAATFDLRSDR